MTLTRHFSYFVSDRCLIVFVYIFSCRMFRSIFFVYDFAFWIVCLEFAVHEFPFDIVVSGLSVMICGLVVLCPF